MSDVAEAQKRIVELQEQVVKVVENDSKAPVVNNHVRNISINVFLNENCKNAMNLTDFLERLSMTFNDLRITGDQGHAAGISNVIMKGLEDIPSTERPLHCTDAKRLKFYVHSCRRTRQTTLRTYTYRFQSSRHNTRRLPR